MAARMAFLEEQLAEKDKALGRMKRQPWRTASSSAARIVALEQQVASMDHELADKDEQLFLKDQQLFAFRLPFVHQELLELPRFVASSPLYSKPGFSKSRSAELLDAEQ